MKKAIMLLFAMFALTSCFGGEKTPSSGLETYTGDSFSVQKPSSWIKAPDDILPKPMVGKIALATTSSEIKYGFANNFLILTQDLSKDISSKEYSISNNLLSQKEYSEYIELKDKEFSFLDGEESRLYLFEAKYNMTSPKLKFLQVARVCPGKKSFLLTIAISLDIKDTAKYENILKTFQCEVQK